MFKVSNEFKVGVIAVFSLVLLYYGFNFLKGRNLLQNRLEYFAIYSKVDGLGPNNPVKLNGYIVGKVSRTQLIKDGSGRILVGFYITEPNFVIPENSMARLVSFDLLGSKGISLELGDAEELAQNGDTLMSDIEADLATVVDQRIAPLEKRATALIGNVDSALIIVQNILNEDARGNLSASFENIKSSFESFERTSKRLDTLVALEKIKIDAIMSHIESITGNLKNNNELISHAVKNLSDVSDSLANANITETVNNANKAMLDLSAVVDRINRGEGSLGLLLNNDTLYNNLESASLELDKLLEDVRVNPKRYVHFSVFGKSEKPSQKPEKKQR